MRKSCKIVKITFDLTYALILWSSSLSGKASWPLLTSITRGSNFSFESWCKVWFRKMSIYSILWSLSSPSGIFVALTRIVYLSPTIYFWIISLLFGIVCSYRPLIWFIYGWKVSNSIYLPARTNEIPHSILAKFLSSSFICTHFHFRGGHVSWITLNSSSESIFQGF